jgi:hypothetical protein
MASTSRVLSFRLSCFATEVSSVLAQTASAPTSKPIVLLRIVEQSKAKTTAKPVARHKFASQSRIRRYARLARRHHPVQAHASEEVRPATVAPVVPPAPLQPPAPPAAEQLGKFVVGGNALQVASSAEVNELDLPANNSLLQSNGAPPNSVTEDNPPMREIADAAKSDFANVTVTQEGSHVVVDADPSSAVVDERISHVLVRRKVRSVRSR